MCGWTLGRHAHDAQGFDRAPGHARQPVIDVLQQETALLRPLPIHHRRMRHRLGPGRQRQRIHAGDIRIAIEQFLIAKGVQEIDSHGIDRIPFIAHRRAAGVRREPVRRPAHQKIFFGQRIRIGIIMLGPALRLGEANLGRQPRQRRLLFQASRAVQQTEGSPGDGMVRRRGEDQFRGAGDGARLKHRLRFNGVIAINQLRIRAVLVG